MSGAELCCDNELQVFSRGIDKDMVCLLAARASRLENQDAIDAAIVGMLADPKEVRALTSFLWNKWRREGPGGF